MSKLALWACIAATAACAKNDSKLDGVAAAKPTSPSAAPASSGAAMRAAAGSMDERLARIERRLEKVADALDRALGPAQPDPSLVYSVPISPSDPVEGPADAKVTVVEAFEFLCPFCYMVNPAVEQVLAKYPKDVRVVSKYLLIHGQPAVAAAKVACAANRQGKYPQVKAALWNALFKMEGQQPQVQTAAANLDAMKQLAISAGADAAKLTADIEDPTCQDWLKSSMQTLQPIGVSATPSFFVNGRFVQGVSFEPLDEVIKQELAKADKAIADGVPQDQYYQREIVAKGERRAKGRFDD
jgi:protein-disulfide isomerase